jgi:putative transposase
MADYHIPLMPGEQYHILSRAVGNEKIFMEPDNYSFFISRWIKHITPVADTFAYCLLPNHFHFMVRIKEEPVLEANFLKVKTNSKSYTPECLPEFIMERFSNLLNSYTKSFNKRYHRKGGLFIDYLRRVEIKTDAQFGACIFYIHKNPVHHGYCKHPEQWTWSSYNEILKGQPSSSWLSGAEVMNHFNGRKSFIDHHNQPIEIKRADDR